MNRTAILSAAAAVAVTAGAVGLAVGGHATPPAPATHWCYREPPPPFPPECIVHRDGDPISKDTIVAGSTYADGRKVALVSNCETFVCPPDP